MANWTYDPSQYQERAYELIPAGDYRARITDVVEKVFSTGSSGYEITMAINGYNSHLWFYLVIDPSNAARTNQNIGDFFNAFGITSPAMGTGKQWIGATGAVRVKNEEYKGNMTAKIAYCINRSRQENLPPWKNKPGTPTQEPAIQNVEIPSELPADIPFH